MSALELRPEVAAFAQLMERELRANDHKGGWAREHPGPLMDRLWEEAHELSVYFGPGSRSDYATWQAQIGSEAADVANFAMMIADVCGALAPPAESGAGDGAARVHERSASTDPISSLTHPETSEHAAKSESAP